MTSVQTTNPSQVNKTAPEAIKQAAACCGTDEQATCCAPLEKAECCESPKAKTAGGCGCR
jgi:hypothetical protein